MLTDPLSSERGVKAKQLRDSPRIVFRECDSINIRVRNNLISNKYDLLSIIPISIKLPSIKTKPYEIHKTYF